MKYKNKKGENYYRDKTKRLLHELNTVHDAESQEALKRRIAKLQKLLKEKYGITVKLEKGEW